MSRLEYKIINLLVVKKEMNFRYYAIGIIENDKLHTNPYLGLQDHFDKEIIKKTTSLDSYLKSKFCVVLINQY